MKNTLKILSLILLLLIPLTLLTSCTTGTEKIDEDKSLTELATKVIDNLIAKDKEAVTFYVADISSQEEFEKNYAEIEGMFDGIGDYTLELVTAERGRNGGITTHTQLYILFSEKTNVAISVTAVAGSDKISGFQSGVADNETLTFTELSGTVSTLKESNGLQILLMVISLLEILFIVFAAIDCYRHNVESKFLWMAFIIIGIATISFTYGENVFFMGFKINFILQYPSLVTHMGGLASVRIMLPLGAVAYFILRKKITKPKITPVTDTRKYSYHTESYVEEAAEVPTETPSKVDTQPAVDSKGGEQNQGATDG